MKFLVFLYWRLLPSVNIRVYYRAARNPFGTPRFDEIMLKTCFDQCTPLEQEFLRKVAS